MVYDKIWDKIHGSRGWLTYPDHSMVGWVMNTYINGKENKKVRILDFGCGQGTSMIFLAANGGIPRDRIDIEATGLDGSVSALYKLQQNLDAHNLKATVVCSDMAKTPFENGYFDAVIDMVSVCMNSNYIEIYNEVHRILKPGGGFLSKVPSDDCTQKLFENRGHTEFFTKEKIHQALDDKFKLNIWSERIENEAGTQKLNHWIIDGLRL